MKGATAVLQRKCACGKESKDGASCAECSAKEKGVLQRHACNSASTNVIAPNNPEVRTSAFAPSLTGIRVSSGFPVFRKLMIGASNDALEQEADRVADQVLAAPAHPAVTNRSPQIQRFTGQATGKVDTAPASVDSVIASPGRPLDPLLRRDMDQRFGYDFSQVRVHSDAAAEQSARDVQAHAYTVGRNIVFGSGRFVPGTHEGRRLIAHELTHVVQQSGADKIGGGLGQDIHGSPTILPLLASNSGSGASIGNGVVQRQTMPMPFEPFARPFPVPRVGPLPGVGVPETGPLPPLIGPMPGLGDMEPEIEIEDLPNRIEDNPEGGEKTKPSEGPSQNPEPGPAPVPPIAPVPRTESDKEDKNQCGSQRLPFTKVTWTTGSLGQAGTVKASPLTKCPGNTKGSLARGDIYPAQYNCMNEAQRRAWPPCHVLHGRTPRTLDRNLHGPGNEKWNIIFGDNGVNSSMSATIEKWALFRVYDLSQVLWLESKVDSYFPGNELFAKQITARYGLYNVNTGSEGPQLDTQSFTSTKAPPICPTAVPTVPAAPPAVPAVPPKAPADLDSTISICAQELKGQHIFDVKGGGLEIKLQAQGIGVKCSIPDYVVTLWKSNKYWIDGQMSRTKVPTGKQVKLTWRNLSYGQYYLHFKIGVHDSACCLKGGVSVRSFTTLRPGDIIA